MHTAPEMSFAMWAIIIGALLMIIVLSGTLLKRLPLSTAMLYLAAGIGLGPAGLAVLMPEPLLHSPLLEKTTEIAVLVSLFAAGLKLGLPLSNRHWQMPVRLAFVSMTITIALITLLGVYGLGLSLGAAILLGGILAPTDPVLASDVQVEHATDRDRLRFILTGEGGLNDGAAFPFVMLGLGLLGLHDLGVWGWRWLLVDVLWAIVGGLVIGAVLGALIGKLVVYLRSRHKESVGLDEFLALGLIALAYGVSVFCHAYGFLAVFAAGLALQRVREQDISESDGMIAVEVNEELLPDVEALATDPEHASAYMMHAVQIFNGQLERIAELTVVVVIGAMLAYTSIVISAIGFTFLLFMVIRPISISLGLLGAPVSRDQVRLISWFGIRGIGSIYYLMYAINHGVPASEAEQLVTFTLTTVAISIVLHGISVTPLMTIYNKRKARFRSNLGWKPPE